MHWFSITVPASALRVSTKLASACTSTGSLTEPTFKATSRFGLPATCRTMPDYTYLLKPSLLTSS